MTSSSDGREVRSGWQKTLSALSALASLVWLLVSIVVFPIGLVRLFRYYDSKKTKDSFTDRYFFSPVWYLWNNILKGIWQVVWVVFCIVVFPVGIFIVARWIITGSARKAWAQFGSFLGTWNKTGDTWNWMRFISLKDMFHFHILSWPLTLMAFIQWEVGHELQWVGITFLILHILAIRTYFQDLPPQRFLFRTIPQIVLVIVADIGVRFGFQHAWPYIEGKTIPYIGYTFAQDITFGERGILAPFFEWVNSGDLYIKTWLLFMYSLIWWYVITKVFIDAVLNRRAELDSRTLQRYRWLEREETLQVYMRNSVLEFPDVFETIFSGTGNIILDTNRGKIRFDNVFGLWWLMAAYNGLRNSKTVQERKAAAAGANEDAAELVKTASEEEHDVGHGTGEMDSRVADAFADENREGYFEVEGDHNPG